MEPADDNSLRAKHLGATEFKSSWLCGISPPDPFSFIDDR
jgi:hypothetical protein